MSVNLVFEQKLPTAVGYCSGVCFAHALSLSVLLIQVTFMILYLLFHFSSKFVPGLVQRFVKADLSRATSLLLWATYTILSRQPPSEHQRHQSHLLPILAEIVFVLHSQGLAAFGITKDTLLTLKGIWQDEKICRCEEVPFYSINMFFIVCTCLSEDQQCLYPLQNITDTS